MKHFIFFLALFGLLAFTSCEKDTFPDPIDDIVKTSWTVSPDGETARPWDFQEDGTLVIGDPGNLGETVQVYTYSFASELEVDLTLTGQKAAGDYYPLPIPIQYKLLLTPLGNYYEGVMQGERAGTIPTVLIFKRE